MAEHTPGPWAAHCTPKGGYTITPASDYYSTVVCARNDWDHRASESNANAHLIASAPELLEALRHMEGYASAYASVCDKLGHNTGGVRERIAEARAAIAKAEGRTDGR